MLIIGAKGFAKELLDVCHQLGETDNLVFYDDVSSDLPEKLFGKFDILCSGEAARSYFKNTDKRFALGLGNPFLRQKMAEQFTNWGGELTSLISPKANIGSFGVEIACGVTILAGATITNEVKIGKGLLMYPNAIITHDCILGDFIELSPGATILGNCTIQALSQIGANATILSGIRISEQCTVGAGAVVTKDVEANKTVKGIPAK